jgi:RIO kinase 1
MQDFSQIIEQAKAFGHIVAVVSHIKSGKEAAVFRAMLDGKIVAMKVYKNPEERSFQNAYEYLAGKFYKSPSARRAVAKKNKFGRKLKQKNWIKREFFMLQKFHEAGATIPRPILQIDDSIFMELLGDEGIVAPRLIDIELDQNEAATAYHSIIESMLIFWEHGIVHADLSPYNVLWWKSKPFIIDFPQSIDKRLHHDARNILDRDLKNITKYFGRYTEVDLAAAEKRFK